MITTKNVSSQIWAYFDLAPARVAIEGMIALHKLDLARTYMAQLTDNNVV